MLDQLVKEHGPVAVARGLFHVGCRLISDGRGPGEAQAELKRALAKAHVRAKAALDRPFARSKPDALGPSGAQT